MRRNHYLHIYDLSGPAIRKPGSPIDPLIWTHASHLDKRIQHIVSVYGPCSMENNSKTKISKEKISSTWSGDDEAMLVRTMKKAKEDGKWGDNNPKPTAWTACVEALSGSEGASGGAPKGAKAIKSRWQRVCAHPISCMRTFMTFSAQTRI